MKEKTDNELIAEFRGMTSSFDTYYCPEQKCHFEITDLKYDTSWDWLMPVVEKIESLGYYNNNFKNTRDQKYYCSFHDKDCETVAHTSPDYTKIDSFYKAVVEFIKLYNQQAK
jgi:hypothetical protein